LGSRGKTDPALLEQLAIPGPFERGNGQILHALSPSLLLAACRYILKAKDDGFLYVSELKFAKAAQIIVENLEGQDVDNLIDQATGFELRKQQLKEHLAYFTAETFALEAARWIKAIPDPFFERLFLFKSVSWENLLRHRMVVVVFLLENIFSRLADETLAALSKSKPKMTYRKGNQPEQYWPTPALQAHLQSLHALMDASENNESIFNLLIESALPIKRAYRTAKIQQESSTLLDETLKKSVLKPWNN
jgi:hypothetical protein